MGCLEIRKRLSGYADGELGADERDGIGAHLERCGACRQELQEQGALDMLLKKHYDAAPPPGYLDTFWPTVEQRIEQDAPGDAAGSGRDHDEEIVFKASPALKMLNIPDRERPEPESPAPEVATPVAPPPQQTSYRWPVAFVLAVGVGTAGILIHKKMNPPVQPPFQRTGTIAEPGSPAGDPELAGYAASQPAAAADAMVVASAPRSEEITSEGIAREPRAVPGAARQRRAAKRARRHESLAPAEQPAAPSEGEPVPAEPKPAAKPPVPGKKTDLDSLIDDAIGTKAAPAKPARAAPAPAAGPAVPDQLNMNQIRSAMRTVKGLVQACYDKYQIEGKATVRLTITRAGTVSNALVKGKFFGTDTGTCVVTAVKKAKFPKFSGKEMTITYPFILE